MSADGPRGQDRRRFAGPPMVPLDVTLPQALVSAPGTDALRGGPASVSYAELRERAWRCAGGLRALGVAPGDRVALLMWNRPEFLVAQYGALAAGAVVVPLNARLAAAELGKILAHSGASVVVAEEEFRGARFLDTILGLRPELPALRHVLAADRLPAGDPGGLPALSARDPAVLIYTSGTTGEPKGCLHAHRSLVTSAAVTARLKGLGPDDRILASVPFFNAFGLVNCVLEAFLSGAAVVVQATFDAAESLALIERERVTVFLGTPTMWIRLLEHPEAARRDLSSLRTGMMAGAVPPLELVERWGARGCDVNVVYGLSEALSILSGGRPTAGVEVEVTEAGELRARGFNQMLGYYRDEAATAARRTDGWLATGDLADIEEDGRIRVTGRADDMVIVGGFNVQPGEVEQALRAHPAVADAAAFGVADRDLGQVMAAWVVPRHGARVGEEELRVFCRERLARYKAPRRLRLVEELPLTANGKVQRFRMREVESEATPAAPAAGS